MMYPMSASGGMDRKSSSNASISGCVRKRHLSTAHRVTVQIILAEVYDVILRARHIAGAPPLPCPASRWEGRGGEEEEEMV